MLDKQRYILDIFTEKDVILRNRHFILSKGNHSADYVNMRVLRDDKKLVQTLGSWLGDAVREYQGDIALAPAGLGFELAQHAARGTVSGMAASVELVGNGEQQHVDPRIQEQLAALVRGRRVVVVDDSLTSGKTVRVLTRFVSQSGGSPVAAAVVARRTPEITAADCLTEYLEILADLPGFMVYAPDQCADFGPCSRRDPVVLRPGHGHEWVRNHSDYPTVSV